MMLKQVVCWLIASLASVSPVQALVSFELQSYDPAVMHYSSTPEQARQKALAWSGDPHLELTFLGVYTGLGDTESGALYRFDSKDGRQRFSCSCRTGEVLGWKDDNASAAARGKVSGPRSADVSTFLPLSELDALQRAFLSSRCPGFAAKKMQLCVPGCPSEYCQRLPNGVWWRYYYVSCDANEETGQIFRYDDEFENPPAVSGDYCVSEETALTNAIDYVKTLDCAWEDQPPVYPKSVFLWQSHGIWLLKDGKTTKLEWCFDIVADTADAGLTRDAVVRELRDGVGAPETRLVLNVEVDAKTGKVLDHIPADAEYIAPSTAKPTIQPAAGTYSSNIAVTISHSDPKAVIRYTLDGTSPTKDSPKYTAPLTIDHSLTLKARAFSEKHRSSEVTMAAYELKPDAQVSPNG